MSCSFLCLSATLQSIKLLSNTEILHVSVWKTKYAKTTLHSEGSFKAPAWAPEQKLPLHCLLRLSSHPMFAMAWTPILRFSLLFVSWEVLSEAEEARWHCVFADYPERNTHLGLMRIWRWGKVRGASSVSWVGPCVMCPVRVSGAPLRSFVCFVSLIPALWLEEVTRVWEWHHQHLWIAGNWCSFELMWLQVAPDHRQMQMCFQNTWVEQWLWICCAAALGTVLSFWKEYEMLCKALNLEKIKV